MQDVGSEDIWDAV